MRSNMGKTWNVDDDVRDKGDSTVTAMPIRTSNAKAIVEAAHRQSLQKPKTDCRELVESNVSLPIPTPSIHLHSCSCTCPESHRDLSQHQHEDEALARQIHAAAAACRARTLSSPASSPKLASLAAFQSVSRWLTGSTPANSTLVSELCAAVAGLDIAKAARLLLDESVPINGRNAAGVPPLICAVRSPLHKTRPLSHTAMVAFLLDAGADPNTTTATSPATGSISALAAAAALGHVPAVHLLLSRGASPDAKTTTLPMFRFSGHGLTALHVAVFANQPAVVEALLCSPSSPSRSGPADLHATFDGYLAEPDLSSPADTKPSSPGRRQRDRRVWTTRISALHLADDSPGCAAALLRRGADPDARDGAGRTPLHWAVAAGGSGSADAVRLLLRCGAPADALDDDGASPLALLVARLEAGAARPGYPDIVAVLLAAGANPDLRYPRDVSVKARLLAMEEWRATYEGIFEKHQLRSPGVVQGAWS